MISKVKRFYGMSDIAIDKIRDCKKCTICQYRKSVVIGRSNLINEKAESSFKFNEAIEIVFIGEAPGRSEDLLEYPFVGASGRLLNFLIKKTIDKIREENPEFVEPTYFITNTIFCRPTDENYGDNREPTNEEILNCSPNVMTVIKSLNPKQIIFIGKTAESAYKREFRTGKSIQHPSYILRNGGVNSAAFFDNVMRLHDIILTIKE